jgi:hypothetical protein
MEWLEYFLGLIPHVRKKIDDGLIDRVGFATRAHGTI